MVVELVLGGFRSFHVLVTMESQFMKVFNIDIGF